MAYQICCLFTNTIMMIRWDTYPVMDARGRAAGALGRSLETRLTIRMDTITRSIGSDGRTRS